MQRSQKIEIRRRPRACNNGSSNYPIRSLPPRGEGSGQLESLTGYVHRLAAHHSMTPVVFLKSIADITRETTAEWGHWLSGANSYSINGTGDLARRVHGILVDGTGSAGHVRLSFSSCRRLLGRRAPTLLRDYLAWCPACCHEDSNEPYHRLLWSVQDAEVCPVHHLALRQNCPACGARQRVFRRHPVWFVCSQCGGNLLDRPGENIGYAHDDASIWYAKDIEQFIGRICSSGVQPTAALFVERLEVLRARLRDQGMDDGEVIGLPGYLSKNWSRRACHPSSRALWTISYRLGIPSADILYGSLPLLESAGSELSSIGRIGSAQNRLDPKGRKEVEIVLREALERPLEEAPSLSRLSLETGINKGRFGYHCPELKQQVVDRRARSSENEASARKRERLKEVRRACYGMVDRAIYPSDRNLKKRTQCKASDFRRPEIKEVVELFREAFPDRPSEDDLRLVPDHAIPDAIASGISDKSG